MTMFLSALLALGALISASVLLIVHRASISEFFGNEGTPDPRWYTWWRFVSLTALGFSLGASFGPEACHFRYTDEPPAIEEREPTEESDVG